MKGKKMCVCVCVRVPVRVDVRTGVSFNDGMEDALQGGVTYVAVRSGSQSHVSFVKGGRRPPTMKREDNGSSRTACTVA